MAYIPPPEPGTPTPVPPGLGSVIAIGSAVAIGCAFVVGVFGGITDIQSAWAAILLGWLVGLAIRRSRSDSPTAIAGASIALAGSALASLIAVTLRIVKEAHVPLAVVLAHIPQVISTVPEGIGWFGFLCWALAAYLGWVTVSRGRRPQSPALPSAVASGGLGQQPYGAWSGPGQQPGAYGPPASGPPGNPGPGGSAQPGFGPEGRERR
jgi:hypothetical protein